LERAVSTPLVDVEPVKVDCSVGGRTSKVICDRRSDIGIVVRCVSNGHLSIAFRHHVGFDIAYSGFDKSTGAGIGVVVGNFISGEIAEHVGVGGKHVDDTGVALENLDRPGWVGTVDRFTGRRQVRDDIDAYH